VLVIEDDEWVSRLLSNAIRDAGYDVVTSATAKEGFEMTCSEEPRCIICDVELPDDDGFWVARSIRALPTRVSATPFIFLTGLDDPQSRMEGYQVGADIYITKPFRIGELVARVNAFLRRTAARTETVCRFGPFQLNRSAHKLFHHGREIELTTKEFRLLEFFATRPGRALTRDDILNHVWGQSVVVTPRSIDRCVATLRAKIESDSSQPTYVHTIRDVGYRFEPGD